MQGLNRRGATLLELLLALALSVIVLSAIGAAIEMHLKMLGTRRTQVEETQLARAVLRRIADDLRSAVQYEVLDVSGLKSLAGDALAGAAGIDPTMLSGLADQAGVDAGGLLGEDEPLDIASSVAPPTIPGLYGNQFELQIDVSRLPRIDEYHVLFNPLDTTQVVDIPSDVKTVAYYLSPDLATTAAPGALTDPNESERIRVTGYAGRGLVRRELDRAVTTWAMNNVNVKDLAQSGKMLAPEVTGLEFRYFDGAEWWPEWNSDARQGLPVAVAIAIEIGGDPGLLEPGETPRSLLTISPDEPVNPASAARALYQLVVHLPASVPTSTDTQRFMDEMEELEDEATDSTGSAASNNPSNQNSQPGGSQGMSGGGMSGNGGGPPGGFGGGQSSGGQSGGRPGAGGPSGGGPPSGFGGGQGGGRPGGGGPPGGFGGGQGGGRSGGGGPPGGFGGGQGGGGQRGGGPGGGGQRGGGGGGGGGGGRGGR
jgi:hypothetical protein